MEESITVNCELREVEKDKTARIIFSIFISIYSWYRGDLL
jgi:hypothetical protein